MDNKKRNLLEDRNPANLKKQKGKDPEKTPSQDSLECDGVVFNSSPTLSDSSASETTSPLKGAGLSPYPLISSSSQSTSPVAEKRTKSVVANSTVGGEFSTEKKGRTKIGPQGEHASAYILYEELVFSAIRGSHISNAHELLKESFDCLVFDQKHEGRILTASEDVMSQLDSNISKDALSNLTKAFKASAMLVRSKDYILRCIDQVESEKSPKIEELFKYMELPLPSRKEIRDTIRIGNRAILSEAVTKLIDAYLLAANKLQYVSFPIDEDLKNPHTGKEKSARDNLLLLNDLIYAVKKFNAADHDKAESVIDDRALEQLGKAFGINADVISTMCKSQEPGEGLEQSHIERIATMVNYLFCYRRVEGEPIDAASDHWKKTVERRRYTKDTKPRNNDKDILYHVTARHIVLIFNCFKGLQQLGSDTQDNIIDAFLDCVLEEQGWANEPGVNKANLLEGIKSKATIEISHFSMKKGQERSTKTADSPRNRCTKEII